VAVYFAADTEYVVRSYLNSETVTDSNPTANVEWHCLVVNGKGKPVYVRGTYGRRGYFEGRVRNGEAEVSFYEVTQGGEMKPASGAGTLKYSEDLETVTGKYWSSGESTLRNSWGDWGITEPCEDCWPEDWAKHTVATKLCLWDPKVTEIGFDQEPEDLIYGEDGYAETFILSGLGNADHEGVLLGAYDYTYDNGDLETGNYGHNTIVALLKTGAVTASTWHATSGPYEGNSGPYVQRTVNTVEKGQLYHGFFCNTETNAKGKISFADCVTQTATVRDETDSELAAALLASYSENPDEEETAWITRLSTVFLKVMGSMFN
jgi:hypothetical protein